MLSTVFDLSFTEDVEARDEETVDAGRGDSVSYFLLLILDLSLRLGLLSVSILFKAPEDLLLFLDGILGNIACLDSHNLRNSFTDSV